MIIPIDFEYKAYSGGMDHVCVSYKVGDKTRSKWLYNDEMAKIDFIHDMKDLEGETLLCFNASAEASALYWLGVDPLKYKWIDLQLEWKMLVNHNDDLAYGRQYIDGKYKRTRKKSYNDTSKGAFDKPPKNLLGMTYKMLGLEVDQDHKDAMRDLIIHTPNFTEDQKKEIMEYCESDINELTDILAKVLHQYENVLPTRNNLDTIVSEIHYRGESGVRTALMECLGYPIHLEEALNFKANIPKLLKDLQEDINSQFDWELFTLNKKTNKYKENQKEIKKFIEDSEYGKLWPKTDKDNYSIKIDNFEKFFSYKHDYPRNNVFAQVMRYKKYKQNLNGFLPKDVTAKNNKTLFSFVNEKTWRVHPYLNCYGSQSARWQPSATSFINLKSAIFRGLVHPKPDNVIVSCDYASEEFLLAALISKDANMIEAYKSGDVYLYFAKLAGAVPWDGTKAEYKSERDLFKATTLGISYLMGPKSLARKLTADTGIKHTDDMAQELIDKFDQAYPDYSRYRDDIVNQYYEQGYLKTPCGWYLFGDNDNFRSVANFPIQSFGSSVLRKALQLSQDAGLKVIFTLHDACYYEVRHDEIYKIKLISKIMKEAFAFYFEGEMKEKAHNLIRIDTNMWGDSLKNEELEFEGMKIKTQTRYEDERAKNEIEIFRKYFQSS